MSNPMSKDDRRLKQRFFTKRTSRGYRGCDIKVRSRNYI